MGCCLDVVDGWEVKLEVSPALTQAQASEHAIARMQLNGTTRFAHTHSIDLSQMPTGPCFETCGSSSHSCYCHRAHMVSCGFVADHCQPVLKKLDYGYTSYPIIVPSLTLQLLHLHLHSTYKRCPRLHCPAGRASHTCYPSFAGMRGGL